MSNSIHVLVVEDSPVAQKVMAIHMTEQGCEIDIADDGVTGLEKAMKNSYDLILMDIGLGEGPDGFEVTKQIKQHSELNKTTPVIAVTAHNESDYHDRASECGMVGYFNKPFTAREAEIIMDALKKLSA